MLAQSWGKLVIVILSVYHMHDCDEMTDRTADVWIPHEMVITLVF